MVVHVSHTQSLASDKTSFHTSDILMIPDDFDRVDNSQDLHISGNSDDSEISTAVDGLSP